ncbi:MAG: DapH/DapD/GlmU-related protein [Gammaproteobacteria bacterium]
MRKSYKIQQSVSSGAESAASRYMDLVVGQQGIVRLLLHEFVILVASKRSGALGIWLRQKMYPWIIGEVGRNVVFGSGIMLRHPHKIRIGDGAIIDENVSLDAKGQNNRGIRLDRGVFIGRNSILSCKDGDISLGANTNIGFNCVLATTSSIKLGADNIIAAYTYIIGGGNYHIDGVDTPMAQAYDYEGKGGVELEDDVWLGAHVSVLDGVTIERGCVVSAGAVVTKSLATRSIAMGVPARVIRTRK